MNHTLFNKTLLAATISAAMLLAGCSADGSGTDGIDDGGEGSLFPNDGTTPTGITEGSTVNPDGSIATPGTTIEVGRNFICTAGAKDFGATPTTEIGLNGLVGDLLGPLVATLGGASVTALLNSVDEPDNVIDNKLQTFATFTQTADLLGVLASVDLFVNVGQTVNSGNYAVFGVRFPADLVAASIINTVKVTTYLDGVPQEAASIDGTTIDLLGANLVGPTRAFVGVKTTKNYDRAAVSFSPGLLSANVGEALFAHELCTQGRFVDAPAP